MASFTTAYTRFVQPFEGGYAYVVGDKGGETYAGIARNFHSTWSGWLVIDRIKKTRALKHNEVIPELTAPVTTFYATLWNAGGFDKINNQDIANLLFDYYVNSGNYAIRDLQNIVNVNVDGKLGPLTIAMVNAGDTVKIHNDLKAARTARLQKIIANDPTQAKFAAGWFARVGAFPTLVAGGVVALIVGAILLFLIIKK